jgi:hypothetical protein
MPRGLKCGDLVDVLVEPGPGEVLVDVLADLERRHHIEFRPDDDTEGTETDGDTEIVITERGRRTVAHLTRGQHDIERADVGGQAAVVVAGPVRAGGNGPGDRDVRKRGVVAQTEPVLGQVQPDRAVARAAADRDAAAVGSKLERRIQALQRDQRGVGVGEIGERVPTAQRVQALLTGDEFLHLFDRIRPVHHRRVVGVVTGPVQACAHVGAGCTDGIGTAEVTAQM